MGRQQDVDVARGLLQQVPSSGSFQVTGQQDSPPGEFDQQHDAVRVVVGMGTAERGMQYPELDAVVESNSVVVANKSNRNAAGGGRIAGRGDRGLLEIEELLRHEQLPD